MGSDEGGSGTGVAVEEDDNVGGVIPQENVASLGGPDMGAGARGKANRVGVLKHWREGHAVAADAHVEAHAAGELLGRQTVESPAERGRVATKGNDNRDVHALL